MKKLCPCLNATVAECDWPHSCGKTWLDELAREIVAKGDGDLIKTLGGLHAHARKREWFLKHECEQSPAAGLANRKDRLHGMALGAEYYATLITSIAQQLVPESSREAQD